MTLEEFDSLEIGDIIYNDLQEILVINKEYNEIESLKLELQNIQKRIDKLEEENQLELGSIYEINYHGNIIKGCLIEILKETYRFITDSSAVYNIEKNSKSMFKKLPDESVKNFFKKDSK